MLSPLATEILRTYKLGACSMRILLILDGATLAEDPSERWINGNDLKSHRAIWRTTPALLSPETWVSSGL